MNKTVVGIGEMLWDMLPQGKQLGGAPANFAYHASQMGCDGVAVSAIGTDTLADEIDQHLAHRNIHALLQRNKCATGTVNVTLDAAGVPQYEITANVAWDNMEYTDQMGALASKCDCVCFGSLAQRSETSRNSIIRFLDHMPADSIKVFDINLRQNFYSREIIETSLERATVLKINDDELELVTPMLGLTGDTENRCRQLLGNYGLTAVILTCGANGSSVYTATEMSHLDTPSVDVVDTVGAGDSFTGAFCASILAGKSISEAHRKAVDVAAYVCTCAGAMPQLPAELTDL